MRIALLAAMAVIAGGCATGGADDTPSRISDSSIDAHDDVATGDAHGADSTGETSAEDTLPADTTRADVSPSDTADAAATDSTMVDSAFPDTAVADTAIPDTAIPDTAVPDTAVPDTAVPDTAVPDTAVPDTAVPDTAVPDTAVPDTALPETGTCPSVTLGNFDSGIDGWALDGLWRYHAASASIVAGSTTKYSSSYTQNLTSPTNVDLSACTSATLSFSVRLADDPDYFDKGADKSERLFVQCSGDGGTTWTSVTPSPWPTSQSACATSYCCGTYGAGRSFPLTAQSIVLPATCRTASVRVRFQAKGSSIWNLQNPGWYVDSVKLN